MTTSLDTLNLVEDDLNRFILLQSCVRARHCFEMYHLLKHDKRHQYLRELYMNEKNYIRNIKLLVEFYKEPLVANTLSNKSFITTQEVKCIFTEIDVIFQLNTIFLNELDKLFAPNLLDLICIGPIFEEFGTFFRWYHAYVSNYYTAYKMLSSLRENNTEFANFIQEVGSKSELNLMDIESLLILPVQRIPQYSLILSSIAENTPESHPDYEGTMKALKIMEAVCQFINEKRGEAESIDMVSKISQHLIHFPNLAEPYRRFCMESDFVNLSKSQKATSSFHLISFNDMLLVTKKVDNNYDVIYHALYEYVSLQSYNHPESPLAFELKVKDVVLQLECINQMEKEQWITHIEKSILLAKKVLGEKKTIRRIQLNRFKTRLFQPLAYNYIQSLEPKLNGGNELPKVDTESSVQDLSSSSQADISNSDTQSNKIGKPLKRSMVKTMVETKSRRFSSLELYLGHAKANKKVTILGDFSKFKLDERLKQLIRSAHLVAPVNIPLRGNIDAMIIVFWYMIKLIAGKKVIYQFYLLDITQIFSPNELNFKIRLNNNTTLFIFSEYCNQILYAIRLSLCTAYPGMPESLVFDFNVSSQRVAKPKLDPALLNMGGFLDTYKYTCIYMNSPMRADIIWNLKHLYHRDVNFHLIQMEDLSLMEFKAIIFSLRFNLFFTGLILQDIIITRDMFIILGNFLKFNTNISKLQLINTGITKDHLTGLFTGTFEKSSLVNPRRVKHLEIVDQYLEDRGMINMFHHIEIHQNVMLEVLDIHNSGVGPKAISWIFQLFMRSDSIYETLRYLDISGNKIDLQTSLMIASFLNKQTALTHFNISHTQAKTSAIIEAMITGAPFLSYFNMEGNKEKGIESILIKWLRLALPLEHLNLNATNLNVLGLINILQLISVQPHSKHLTIHADDNDFGLTGALIFSNSSFTIDHVVKISLNKNDFGDEGLCALFNYFGQNMPISLQGLSVNENCKLETNEVRLNMLSALGNFLSDSLCSIKSFSMTSRSKTQTQLKSDIIPLFDTMSKWKVEEIDFSGHKMGAKAIGAFARELKTNQHIRQVTFDDNAFTLSSFEYLIRCIKLNPSILIVRLPMNDIMGIMGQGLTAINAKLSTLISELEMQLSLNHVVSSSITTSPRPDVLLPSKPKNWFSTKPDVSKAQRYKSCGRIQTQGINSSLDDLEDAEPEQGTGM